MTTTIAPAIEKTCSRDHPLSGDNLYVSPRGRNLCRACDRERQRERRQRTGGRRGARLRSHRETLTHVSNAPLRERFLLLEAEGRITANALALHLGWLPPDQRRGTSRGDTQRVRRSLGLTVTHDGRMLDGERNVSVRRTIRYETAVKIALALGMDPFEAGV